MGCSKSSSKREVYSNTILPQETRKTSNRQSYFTPKTTGKRRRKKNPKLSRRTEIVNIQTEINEKEMKKVLETNDNESMTTQHLWDVAKEVPRGKFIAIQSYLKKQEKHQIDSPTLHLKQLEKEGKKIN